MRVERIETFSDPWLCVVRVTTDSGHTGIGQTSPFEADITATVLHRMVARGALGKPVDDPGGFVERVFRYQYKFPGTFLCRAVCGVETAMLDLVAKLKGKPVCELFGGAPRAFQVYASSMRRDLAPAQEIERLQRLSDAHGFGAYKIKIGLPMGDDRDAAPGRTESLLRGMREAFGKQAVLIADANGGYGPERAVEVGRLLEELDYRWFEEPCPFDDLEATALVTRSLEMDVAGGEQDWDLAQWRRIVELPAVNITQPDVCYLGGFHRALRVTQMAHERGLVSIPHSSNPSMVLAFSLHLMSCAPNAGDLIEYGIEPGEWHETLYRGDPLAVRDGRIQTPAGPGWGVEIDPAWLERAEYRESRL